MHNSDLVVLQTVDTCERLANPTPAEIRAESGLTRYSLLTALKRLGSQKLIFRDTEHITLTDAGREILKQYEGKFILRCSTCHRELAIPIEEAPRRYEMRCPHCGGRFLRERVLACPRFDLQFPAPAGQPPTRKNLEGQVVWTYKPYWDEKGRLRCGARNVSGTPCANFAKKGSQGQRCPQHTSSRKPRVKTGFYSKYANATLAEKIEEARQDPELLDLRNEYALLKATLAEEPDIPPRIKAFIVGEIGKLWEKIFRREEGLQVHITIDQQQVMVAQVAAIIDQNLTICPFCHHSLADLKEEIAYQLVSRVKVLCLEKGKEIPPEAVEILERIESAKETTNPKNQLEAPSVEEDSRPVEGRGLRPRRGNAQATGS